MENTLKKEYSFHDQITNIKTILKELNATTIKVSKSKVNGTHEGSIIFAEINEKWFYFSVSEFTFNSKHIKGKIMWRTAKHDKDYQGKDNNWCDTKDLIKQIKNKLKILWMNC